MLCSDIVQGAHIGDSQQPILRALHPIASGSKHVYKCIRPYYIKLRKDLLDNVNIYLTDGTGKKLSLPRTTLRVTLHLRKKNTPWYQS